MNPIYKFQLSAGNDTRQASPLYKDDLAIDYELEQNQEFYRGKLSGKLTFQKDDYEFIRSKAFDTQFDVTIYISYNGGQAWTAYWSGQFWKTDCAFNEDDQTAIVTPSVNDRYNTVLAGMEKEYDLIGLAPEIEQIQIDKRPMIQIYVPGDNVIACFLSGMYWEQDCEVVDSESILTEKYYFALCSSQRVAELTGTTTPVLPDIFNGSVPVVEDSFEYSQGGYKLQFTYTEDSDSSLSVWKIIRESDSTILWSHQETNQLRSLPYTVTLQPQNGAVGTVEVYLHDVKVYGRYITDSPTIGNAPTFQIPDNDMVENNRNYSRVCGYAFNDVIFFSNRLTNTPTKWGIYQPGQYYQQPYVSGVSTFFPVAKSAWSRLSIWFAFSIVDWIVEEKARQTYILKDSYSLASVVSVLLAKIAPGITHEATTEYSQFLYGKNPITGTDYQLFITQKSNILAGNYDQPAQKAPITLKYITDMLRDCFRCYWFIDKQNRFRIEHISYFMLGGTYDGRPLVEINLTEQYVTRNGKPWAYASNQYEFDKPEMPARYQFGWMDDVTQSFEGFPIDIISKYVNQDNIEEITISNFTSDVDYMLLNPSACSSDGFALLAPVLTDGKYKLPYVQFGESLLQNGYMSFEYLQKYYRYDLPAPIYEINNQQYCAYGIKKLKTQTIKFPVLVEPNMFNLIKTGLGDGMIQKMSINLSSRIANTTLKYDTE